jgi:hypothetical protein
MSRVLQPDPTEVAAQQQRLSVLKPNAPAPLASVLTRISHAIVDLSQQGAPIERPRVISFQGPGGNWKIGRFAAHGSAWLGLEWPSDAHRSLIDWLTREMHASELAASRPDVPHGQLWFYFGRVS